MTQRRRRERKPTQKCIAKFALWPGPAEGYAKNQVHRHLWRMHGREQFEDLMQEAFLVYTKVESRYVNEIDNPQWLMALFREALQHRLTDLARRNFRRYTSELTGESEAMEEVIDEHAQPLDMITQLITALDKAPSEFRAALLVLIKAPDELLEEVQKMARRSIGRASQFVCRLTGQPDDRELLVRAREYLKEQIS